MCWSFGASMFFAVIGILVASFLIYKKESKLLWIPILYFALMEFLQFLTYFVINLCHLPSNQILTLLGYIHIAFQPFFISMFTLYFIPEHVREKIKTYVYFICFICTVLILIKLYPFAWAGSCIPGIDAMCGSDLCSYSGSWHLAWSIPYNGIGYSVLMIYMFAAFLVPLIYGAWKISLLHLILGPSLSILLAKSPNEWPAVWCLFSIGLLLVAISKPLFEFLKVEKWYGIDYQKLGFSKKKIKKNKKRN
jgi:hypothetical protein